MNPQARTARCLLAVIVAVTLASAVAFAEGDDAERAPHAPIVIGADSGFTAANGVVSGSGSEEDPYVISSYFIEMDDAAYGISIQGTSRWFRITDCLVSGSRATGIRFLNVVNGMILNCIVRGVEFGIDIDSSRDCEFVGNRLESCGSSVFLFNASFNIFSGNSIQDGTGGFILYKQSTYNKIYDNRVDSGSALLINAGCDNNHIYRNDFLRGRATSHAYNRWQSMADEGNFWSNYSGQDADGDGFGDSIYLLLGAASRECDYRPAMAPYHQDEGDQEP